SERTPWHDGVSTPALLRHARGTYARAIRRALEEAGCEDLPRNGPYVIGSVDRGTTPLAEVILRLGVSKQAAGQLVDTLVVRGYLERSFDPDDRRRTSVSLTTRGRLAARVARKAVD